MGRDKALLEIGGVTLVERIACLVRQAAGTVTIIGPAERFGHLGIPVAADRVDGCGPLGGLYTALSITAADWNLVVACDLPNVTAALFEDLFAAAEHAGCAALVPSTPLVTAPGVAGGGSLEPLCAVYHAGARAAVESAIFHKRFKMQEFVSTIGACIWPAPDPGLFRNVNTPEDWSKHMEARKP